MKPSEKFNFERNLLNIIINTAQNKYSSNWQPLQRKSDPKSRFFYFFNSRKLKSLPLYEFTNKICCMGVERVSSQMAGRVCFCSTWQANQSPKAEAV